MHRRLLLGLLTALTVSGLSTGTALARGQHHGRPRPHQRWEHRARGRTQARWRKHGRWGQRGDSRARDSGSIGSLPVQQMNSTLQLQGSSSNGVLSYSFDRPDINNVTLNGTPISPSFQINGSMDFQPLGGQQAFLNGDLPVPADRLDATISTIIKSGPVFQAEHQHFYDFSPMVWFIHVRGRGSALTLAQGVHSVLAAAGTPLPQTPPTNPSTPFDVNRLKSILHAYSDQVSSNGVVTFLVARRNPVYIDGVQVNPSTNIATNVAFEPLNSSGTQAAVAPDFGMQADEINRVVGTMQAQGWDIGCLYNQETDEHPQLYFSHQFKTGNPYVLAQEIRNGLNQMNSQ